MSSPSAITGFPSPGHNHKRCLSSALERASSAFAHKGLRLTRLRAQVFEEIARSHHSIGAYEIIERLAVHGTRLAPISVYRAIEALMDAGVVHRLESKNAYFACHCIHGAGREHIVLSCERCGTVAEMPAEAVFASIAETARRAGFQPRVRVVEVTGLCAHCGAA
jgi:Fur family zinc uptake transcriptional regulator